MKNAEKSKPKVTITLSVKEKETLDLHSRSVGLKPTHFVKMVLIKEIYTKNRI